MLSINNLSVQFGKRILFDEVNTVFSHGNIYGVIGANGAGKSTFLKIISGDMDPTAGNVHLEIGKRMSVLNQNHNIFDSHTVLETVMMGNKILFTIKSEMDALYADYDDKNADRIGELQVRFEEMNGWNADSDAASLLSSLGISEENHYTLMSDLEGKLKVRVLLAQALFGNPDLLIMDMAIKSPRSETLQSSSVCQWLTKQKALTKVVLFNPRQEKIKDIEHSWAIRRGASDVLPRLSPENLMAEVARVTALIGCSLISQPLEEIARSFGASAGASQASMSELVVISKIEAIKANSKSETKNNSKPNQKSDGGEVVMYRGVRIRR